MSAEEPSVTRSIGARDLTHWRSRAGRRLIRAQRRLVRRSGRHAAIALTLGVGGAAAVGGVWATTFLYDAVAGRAGIEQIDEPMLHAAMRLRGPVVDAAAAGIARVFGPVGMPVLAVAAGGALSARIRDWYTLGTVAVAGAGSLLMTLGGKDVVGRHRPPRRDALPPYEASPSFPSGHTLNATVGCGVLAYLLMLQQRSNVAQVGTAAAATGLAAGVGLSRVLLGAHWFTDVLTGWSAGTGWLAVVITTHRVHLTLRQDAADPR